MPELPEVETTKNGIAPYLAHATIAKLTVRRRDLRWPIPKNLEHTLKGVQVNGITRRGKYLLIATPKGTLIAHLGMSGSLRVIPKGEQNKHALKKHDHYDILTEDGHIIRYHDPRRFGFLLWTTEDPNQHPRIAVLGPEPLSDAFTAEYLHKASRKRTATVKSFIMDSHIVVGVGNIYASESLFGAGIRPTAQAGKISLARYEKLVECIKTVLARAIKQGGTTLKDFVNSNGEPGYFAQQLNVYGREGEPCRRCSGVIKQKTIGQRASFYCPKCQN